MNTALKLSIFDYELDGGNLDEATPYFQKYDYRHQLVVEDDGDAIPFVWLFYSRKPDNFHLGSTIIEAIFCILSSFLSFEVQVELQNKFPNQGRMDWLLL